jgi:hypothetical protein
MPLYEYRCECGAVLESLESVSSKRGACADLCVKTSGKVGKGKVERIFSLGLIRGDGREAKEATFDPCKRSGRPGGGCDGDEY